MSNDPAKATDKNPFSLLLPAHCTAESLPDCPYVVAEFTPAGLVLLARLRQSAESAEGRGATTYVDINDMGSGVSVRWLEDFSDATARDSTIPVNLPGREASATGTEDIEWVGHPVNDRLAVHKDGFWLEAEVKHSDSGVESAPLEWADVPGLAAALDAIDLKGATDKAAYEIVALKKRISELEQILENERAGISTVAVASHTDSSGFASVQVYRSLATARSDFAGQCREQEGIKTDMDDKKYIADYLKRNPDEDFWVGEMSVKGGQQAVSTVAVTIREQDGHHCMDVRAYPSLAAAHAALAGELREKDGFWEKGEMEGLDDEEVISEYANRVGDNEYVWVGPVAVEGLSDSIPSTGIVPADGAMLDNTKPSDTKPSNTKPSNTKSRVLVFVEEGVAHDWVSDENVDVLVFDKDNLDAGDDFEIPERFDDLAPQWLKDLLAERDGDRPGMA